jgi:ribosomal protein S18 acetylase RimI-like enzyme
VFVQPLKFKIVPAYDVALADQARVFTDAFAGYVAGSFQFDAPSLAAFLSGHGIDLCYSRFVRDDGGHLVSFGYINRTGNIARLGGMGTIPGARRSGAAALLVSKLLSEAKERRDERMVLEVIEQNPAAVALYRSQGFEIVLRLSGWRSSAANSQGDATDVRQISMIDALRLRTNLDYPDLPWQISRHAMAKVALGQAFALEDAAVVTGNPGTSPTRIHGYLGLTGKNWPILRKLTSSLVAKFPASVFIAPPIFPEQFGTEIFQPLKFQKEPLSQFLMRKDL